MKHLMFCTVTLFILVGCSGDIEMKSPRQAAVDRCTAEHGVDTQAIDVCVEEALAPDDSDDDRGGMNSMMSGGMM